MFHHGVRVGLDALRLPVELVLPLLVLLSGEFGELLIFPAALRFALLVFLSPALGDLVAPGLARAREPVRLELEVGLQGGERRIALLLEGVKLGIVLRRG